MKRKKNVSRTLARTMAVAIGLLLSCCGPQAALAGSAYLILDAKSGKVLASKNADTLNHPASLTKMMTLYLTFETLHRGNLHWNSRVRFSRYAASRPPTKLWVASGSAVTVREAVLGMIVPSANDAAAAIGEKLAGSEAAFARMMTAKARHLGMKHTVFTNASGLPDRRQVTTARDMSILAVALMNDFPKEYRMFSTRSFKFRGRTIRGHNNLMYRYKGMDGFKTGFTNASGFNLVSAVKSGNRRVIGVVLGGRTARSRDADMQALLDRYIRRAANVRTPSLLASVRVASNSLAAIKDPPIPTRVVRTKAMNTEVASSSRAISDLITATALSERENDKTWQIQVGLSETPDAANAFLGRLASKFKGVLGQAQPITQPVALGKRTVQRARFAGFATNEAAVQACRALVEHHLDCFPIGSGT